MILEFSFQGQDYSNLCLELLYVFPKTEIVAIVTTSPGVLYSDLH